MAKKSKVYKVDYKKLVQEANKVLKRLKGLKPKLKGEEREEIELQIKSLDYLAGVCSAARIKMSGCAIAARAKMSRGCKFPKPPKMSRVYGVQEVKSR